MNINKLAFAAGLLVAVAACNQNGAVNNATSATETTVTSTPATETTATTATTTSAQGATDQQQLVSEAAGVVHNMEADANLRKLMTRAKGIFVAPDYGKGAFIVGGRGGTGVLLARNGTAWSNPVFYDIGGISIGAQAGGSGGPVAMLLMTDQAVNSFKGQNTFSLNANAGFNIVHYNARSQGSVGKGDVILWSNMSGAFAGVSLGVSDIAYDDGANKAYYNQPSLTAQQILSGQVTAPPSATTLVAELPA